VLSEGDDNTTYDAKVGKKAQLIAEFTGRSVDASALGMTIVSA
jgi:hypothetical protein